MLHKRNRDLFSISVGFFFLTVVLALWGAYNVSDKNPNESWLSIWNRWDALHYRRIAENLYARSDLTEQDHAFLSHFPPFFPILIRLTAAICSISLVHAAFLIANLFGLGATLLFYLLVRHEFGRRIALRAVAFFLIFPTAYFAHIPYSEGVFLFLVVACFYCLRVKHLPLTAGLCSALAILTRVVGVSLFPALGAELLLGMRSGRFKTFQIVSAMAAAGGAVVVYLLINLQYYGDALFFLKDYQNAAHAMKLAYVPFSEPILSLYRLMFEGGYRDYFFMSHLGWSAIFLGITSLICLWTAFCLPLSYTLYAFSSLFFVGGMTWAISTPRYMLPIISVPLGLALVRNRSFRWICLSISGVGLFYFSRVFASGAWAF